MKAEYRRDLQNNYLILELPEGAEEEIYQIRMAEQNEIPGLLPFHSSRKDGKRYLHYEITSKQPLKDVYEKKIMNYQDMISLLMGIETILETMQRYLLNPTQLVFDPQYMYLEPGRNRIWLCYMPGAETDCSITLLAEFILKKLDHEEHQAVMLGYNFYQKASEENFSLQQTLKEMLSFAGKEEKRRDIRREVCQPEESEAANGRENLYEEYEPEKDYRKSTQEPEEYEVTHKERPSKKKKGSKIDALFQMIHPAILLSGLFLFALLEILFYLKIIHLTEAGGLFFLLISLEILINKSWRKYRNKKQAEENRWIAEEEDEMYRILREEMYDEVSDAEPIEETRCLMPSPGRNNLRLMFSGEDDGRTVYPDIMIGQKPVFVGKIKGESDVILDSPTVSRVHARLDCRDDRYYLKDLNSKNGTFHNGRRLRPQEQCEILAGDNIGFAEIDYKVMPDKY